MKSFNIILAFIFAAVLFSACSSVTESNQKSIDMQERPHNIEAKMTIGIKSEDMTVSANAVIRIAGEDSVYMDIYGPFGIKFGKLYADREIFYFYNAMEANVLKGEPIAENIRKATFLNISAIEIINLFKNLPPTKLSDFEEKEYIETGKLFQHNNEFLVLNNRRQMVQYQRKNEGNHLELNITYKDFKQYGKYEMPSSFSISAPLVKSEVSVSIKDMTFPESFDKQFKFSVPNNAKVIEL